MNGEKRNLEGGSLYKGLILPYSSTTFRSESSLDWTDSSSKHFIYKVFCGCIGFLQRFAGSTKLMKKFFPLSGCPVSAIDAKLRA